VAGGLRYRLYLLGLADGQLPHRSQPDAGLPVLITITGVGSGIVFFGEVLGLEKIIGGAVVLLGVYLARRNG